MDGPAGPVAKEVPFVNIFDNSGKSSKMLLQGNKNFD